MFLPCNFLRSCFRIGKVLFVRNPSIDGVYDFGISVNTTQRLHVMLLNNRRIQLVWRRLRSLNPPLLLRCGSGLFCWRSDVSDELVTESGGKKIGFFIQNNSIIFPECLTVILVWKPEHSFFDVDTPLDVHPPEVWQQRGVMLQWFISDSKTKAQEFRCYLRSANFTALLFCFPLFQTEVDDSHAEPAGC